MQSQSSLTEYEENSPHYADLDRCVWLAARLWAGDRLMVDHAEDGAGYVGEVGRGEVELPHAD